MLDRKGALGVSDFYLLACVFLVFLTQFVVIHDMSSNE